MADVLVLVPMEVELRPVARRLGLRRRREGTPASVGEHSGVTVVALRCGVGTARAAEVARRGLAEHRPDHVVVAGVAGGLAPGSRPGDLVVPRRVVDLDTGAEHEAAAFGHLVPDGEMVTSATLHGAAALAPHAEAGAAAVDMETAAIAAQCAVAGVRWTAVRGLSDVVGDATVDDSTLALVREDGSNDLGATVRHLARRPGDVVRLARLGRDTSKAMAAVAIALEEALGHHGADRAQLREPDLPM